MMKPLSHPNVLPTHIRERLPDPSRPISEPVVPARQKIMGFEVAFEPHYSPSQNHAQQNPAKNTQTAAEQISPPSMSLEEFMDFLQKQQQQRQKQPFAPLMPLGDFMQLARPLGRKLIEKVLVDCAENYPNLLEQKLTMMVQIGQNLMALYLLCQCKTRKTLNHELSLQTLAGLMYGFIQQHKEVALVTGLETGNITPANVEFAILLLQGKISQQDTLSERVTNISTQNFLTKFNP